MAEGYLNKVMDPLTNPSTGLVGESANNVIINNNMYFMHFSNLALNLFNYKNLPETMDADFLEYTLFIDGRACVVKDPILGLINLRYSEIGKPNIYNLPTKINGYSNDFNNTYEQGDFVIVKNNIQYVPTVLFVDYFTKNIANIDQTIKTNLEAQKTPVVFTGSKEQMVALKNLYFKYVGNVPYIFADEDFKDAIKIDALKTDAPFLADKLVNIKQEYVTEFLSFIGINSVGEKKERLIVDEANANNQFISMNFETMYEERKKAVDAINAKWGTNIIVEPKIGSSILENDKVYNNNENNIEEGGDE